MAFPWGRWHSFGRGSVASAARRRMRLGCERELQLCGDGGRPGDLRAHAKLGREVSSAWRRNGRVFPSARRAARRRSDPFRKAGRCGIAAPKRRPSTRCRSSTASDAEPAPMATRNTTAPKRNEPGNSSYATKGPAITGPFPFRGQTGRLQPGGGSQPSVSRYTMRAVWLPVRMAYWMFQGSSQSPIAYKSMPESASSSSIPLFGTMSKASITVSQG